MYNTSSINSGQHLVTGLTHQLVTGIGAHAEDGVQILGGYPMDVVDGVQINLSDMPSKGHAPDT